MHLLLVHSLIRSFGLARAAVTACGRHVQSPLGTTTAASASYTGAASYDQTSNAPTPPNPPPPTQSNVEQQTGDNVSGLKFNKVNFFGLSIEFSVTTQVRKYFFHLHLYPLNMSCSWTERVPNSAANTEYNI
jgi:hypothetical protein